MDSAGCDASSSDGESVVSRRSPKRPADESPDREPAETTRMEFPGMVTEVMLGVGYTSLPQKSKKEKEHVHQVSKLQQRGA